MDIQKKQMQESAILYYEKNILKMSLQEVLPIKWEQG